MFFGRPVLFIGLASFFLLSTLTAVTHLHFSSGGKIQQECRLCVTGGTRQAFVSTSSTPILSLALLAAVVVLAQKLTSPPLKGEPPTRSPPLFS